MRALEKRDKLMDKNAAAADNNHSNYDDTAKELSKIAPAQKKSTPHNKGYFLRDKSVYIKWKTHMSKYEEHCGENAMKFQGFVEWLLKRCNVSIESDTLQTVKYIWKCTYGEENGAVDSGNTSLADDDASEEYFDEVLMNGTHSRRTSKTCSRNVDVDSELKSTAHLGQRKTSNSKRQLKLFFGKVRNTRSGVSALKSESDFTENCMVDCIESHVGSQIQSSDKSCVLSTPNVTSPIRDMADTEINGKLEFNDLGSLLVEESNGGDFYEDDNDAPNVSNGNTDELLALSDGAIKDQQQTKNSLPFESDEVHGKSQRSQSTQRMTRRDFEIKKKRLSEFNQFQNHETDINSPHCSESVLSQFLGCPLSGSPTADMEGDIYKSSSKFKVIIVGGGISGLTAAQYLLQQKFQVTLLESRLRIGGRIHSVRLNDSTVELGAQYVQGIDENPIADIATQLGLNFSICRSKPITLHDDAGNKIPEWLGDQMQSFLNSVFHSLKTNSIHQDCLLEAQNMFGRDIFDSAIESINVPEDYEEQFDWVESTTKFYELLKSYALKTSHKECEQTAGARTKKNRFRNVKFVVKEETQNVEPVSGDCRVFIKVRRWINQFFQLTDYYLSLLQAIDVIVCPSLNFLSSIVQMYKFDGHDCFFNQGFDHIVNNISLGVDVRLGARVVEIDYTPSGEKSDPVSIKYIDPHGVSRIIQGDAVIVTVPLGVLKQDSIQFKPKLPKEKRDSFSKFKIGTLNRIILLFDTVFWDVEVPYFGVYDVNGSFIFYNLYSSVQQPIIAVLSSGKNAVEMESLSDEQITQKIFDILSSIFTNASKPKVVVTSRWLQDPHSLGSYSYPSNNSLWSDYDLLALPLSNRVYFAGDYTHARHFGTVHGAYESGIREAKRLMNLLCGVEEYEEPLNTVLNNITTVEEELPPMVVDLPWRVENFWNPNINNLEHQKIPLQSIKIQLGMD